MNRSHLTRFISGFPNISKNLQDKLNEKSFKLVNQLQILSDEDLGDHYGFTVEEIGEINDKIKFSYRKLDLPLSARLSGENTGYIRSGSVQFDSVLSRYGLPSGRLTQIFGEAGVGKSQICLQFCFRVQLPVSEGGLNADALYIDTESCFRPERIVQMAQNYFHIDQTKAEECLGRVHVRNINTTADDLVDLFVNGRLDTFLDEHRQVRLLVLDGIAYHFRYSYEHNDSTRFRQLNQIATKLKQIAYERNIAVLITNQVSREKYRPALDDIWNAASSNVLLLMRPPSIVPDDGTKTELEPSLRECFVIKSATAKNPESKTFQQQKGFNFRYQHVKIAESSWLAGLRNCKEVAKMFRGILNRSRFCIVIGQVRNYNQKSDDIFIQRQIRLMGKFDEEIRMTMEKIKKNQKKNRVKRKKEALTVTTNILLDKTSDSPDMSLLSRGYPEQLTDTGSALGQDGIRHLSTRMKIYNSTFLRAVAEIFATDEQLSRNCLDRGMRLTDVRVSRDCRILQIYWMMTNSDQDRDSMASYLNGNKGRLHELLVEMQAVRNVPWINFVYDLRATNEQEVERRLEKCRQDLGIRDPEENFARSSEKQEFKLEDRINFAGEMKIPDGQEDILSKVTPILIPEDMPTNLFNLDYEYLWKKVLTNMHRTRPQHRQDMADRNNIVTGDSNTAPPGNDLKKAQNPLQIDYNTENRIKAIKKFVVANRKRKDKLERKLKRKILSDEMDRFDDYEQLRESLERHYLNTLGDLEPEHRS